MELVYLVQGELIVRERINLGALITIELHGRDVMDNIYAAKVHGPAMGVTEPSRNPGPARRRDGKCVPQ